VAEAEEEHDEADTASSSSGESEDAIEHLLDDLAAHRAEAEGEDVEDEMPADGDVPLPDLEMPVSDAEEEAVHDDMLGLARDGEELELEGDVATLEPAIITSPSRNSSAPAVPAAALAPALAQAADASSSGDAGGLPTHFVFENGAQIRWYPNLRKSEGICSNAAHGRCVLTRTAQPARGRTLGTNPWQGRPLGKIAFFCLNCDCDAFNSKATHLYMEPSVEERRAAREALKAQPRAARLFTFERKRFDGEPEEPYFLQ